MHATLLLAAIGIAAPALKDLPRKDQSPVGEWQVESVVSGGRPRPVGAEPFRYTFTADGKWYLHRGPLEPDETVERAYFTDPKADPPRIDLRYDPAEQESRVGQGIFKVEGDTLTICLRRRGTGRPKAFESTPDVPTTLYVFKRVKPKD